MSIRLLPWWTDQAIDFIEGFVESTRHICPLFFEFGGGNSTIYLAQKGVELITIEHDSEWLEKIKAVISMLPASQGNATLELASRPYHKKLFDNAARLKNRFIVIIVDGRDRIKCIESAVEFCNANDTPHLLILDNSERLANEYAEARPLLDSMYKKSYHFEQPSCRAEGRSISLPDKSGWQAPHRWITSVYFSSKTVDFSTTGSPL